MVHMTFKYVFVGDSGAGKTSINTRFMNRHFDEYCPSTIGAIYNCRDFKLNKINRSIKLQLWDTAGQERFRSMVPIYYRGAAAIILVFDITNRESFNNIVNYWIEQIKDVVKFKVFLLGNKKDLSNQREVSSDEAQNIADSNGFIYKEISAKCEDLEPVLGELTENVFNQLCESQPTIDKLHLFGIDIEKPPQSINWCCN